MKKLISFLICVSAAALAQAETMQFVTMLSQPVGVFERVDLVGQINEGTATDPTGKSTATSLVLCQEGTGCTVTAGTKLAVKNEDSTKTAVTDTALTLEGNNSKLKTEKNTAGNKVAHYYVNTFTLQGGDYNSGEGTTTLFANKLTAASGSSIHISDSGTDKGVKIYLPTATFTYSNPVTTKVASFAQMSIPSIAEYTGTSDDAGTEVGSTLNWNKVDCVGGEKTGCDATTKVLSDITYTKPSGS